MPLIERGAHMERERIATDKGREEETMQEYTRMAHRVQARRRWLHRKSE